MCKLRGIIWYIIHSNRLLLKFWPHFTFGWPFVNISISIHPTHSKLYTFVILIITSRVIWYTWKVIWSILKSWPPTCLLRDPCWEGAKSSKILSKYFLTYNDFINDWLLIYGSKHRKYWFTHVFHCNFTTIVSTEVKLWFLSSCEHFWPDP